MLLETKQILNGRAIIVTMGLITPKVANPNGAEREIKPRRNTRGREIYFGNILCTKTTNLQQNTRHNTIPQRACALYTVRVSTEQPSSTHPAMEHLS